MAELDDRISDFGLQSLPSLPFFSTISSLTPPFPVSHHRSDRTSRIALICNSHCPNEART
jgi:hypothetical protein